MTLLHDFLTWLKEDRRFLGRPISFGAFRFVCEMRRLKVRIGYDHFEEPDA